MGDDTAKPNLRGKTETKMDKRFAAAETPRKPSYVVTIHPIGIEAPLWTWQIDLEEGNGVLDWGQTSTRREAVRQVTRRMRRHSRKTRKEQPEDWWRNAD